MQLSKGTLPSQAEIRQELGDIATKLYKDFLAHGYQPEELGKEPGSVPAVFMLHRIMYTTPEPMKSSLLNYLRNRTFEIAISRDLHVFWEREPHTAGRELSIFAMPVATKILAQVEVFNVAYKTQLSAAQIDALAKEPEPPVMINWRSFVGVDEAAVIQGEEYKRLFSMFAIAKGITAKPITSDDDPFRAQITPAPIAIPMRAGAPPTNTLVPVTIQDSLNEVNQEAAPTHPGTIADEQELNRQQGLVLPPPPAVPSVTAPTPPCIPDAGIQMPQDAYGGQ